MARQHRNNSSQMADILRQDNPRDTHDDTQELETDSKRRHNKETASHKHRTEPGGSDQASSSSSIPSTSAGRSDDRDTRRRQPSGNEPWKEEVPSSCCCFLEDLKRLPQCDTKLGKLTFSKTHTILVDVSVFNTGAGPLAQEGRDMWHSNFVKMPCSPLSFMIKTGVIKQSTQVKRWDVISKQLKGLASKREADVNLLEEAIMKYNPKYKGQWQFDALANFVKCIPKEENYFHSLFPKIAALALRLPELVKKAIPLLKSGQSAEITLSQVQISCLLANAFFCTFPHRNTTRPNTEYYGYPTINFSSLFGNWSQRKKEKLRAIMHYFNVVTDKETEPKGLVTFKRRCLKDADLPNWRSCNETLCKLYVSSSGGIETEGAGMLQVDFAASLIGGGVLSSGLVQEEILFIMNPELIVSRLFTEKLADNECLIITGSQQFSCYSGFRDSFEWAGPYDDTLDRDEWDRLKRQIVAMDALNFKHVGEQYSMRKVTRELIKAFCGFKGHGLKDPDIATGKWGCGAFNGDPQLKAVIQLMAAAKAGRGLAFFTFRDEKLKRDLEQMYSVLVSEGVTVGKLYGLLEDYCSDMRSHRGFHVDLFDFIRNSLGQSRSQL